MPIFDDARSTWGAAANTNPRPVPASDRTGISWHYPGTALNITPATAHTACLSQVKSWQTFHMTDPARMWADIGYNLLVCQHARVIEGRGVDLQGAHSPSVNYTNYGVMFMVSGNTAPTAAMYARGVRLRYDLEQHSGHDLKSIGHMDDPQASTACPGPAIEAWVKSGGPDVPAPAEEPFTVAQYDDIIAKLTAITTKVDTLAGKTTTDHANLATALANMSTANSAEAQTVTDILERVGQLKAQLDALPEGLREQVSESVAAALGGFQLNVTYPSKT